MIKTPVLVSWSGGKDAAWTLHTLRQQGMFEPVGLLTTITTGLDRIAIHGIRRDILQAQARATGLPVIEASIPSRCDNATYEAAFAGALAQARERWPALETIAFGDLFLEDVRAYRETLCNRLGWRLCTPLFGADTAQLARAMIAGGLQAALCCVDTTQLDGGFAGREFDASLLHDLPAHVDPCGERGEFHTCVHGGPMFLRPLALSPGERALHEERFACIDLLLHAAGTGVTNPTAGADTPGR